MTLKQSLDNLKAQVQDSVKDGATLEISSMLVDGITGRKMPELDVAYLEVTLVWAENFHHLHETIMKKQLLNREHAGAGFVQYPQKWRDWASQSVNFEALIDKDNVLDDIAPLQQMLTWKHFDDFSEALDIGKVARHNREGISAELDRLRKSQKRLKRIFDEIDWHSRAGRVNKLTLKQKQEVRKLWELKDGYIFAQNTVQLDGDVIARYNSRLFEDDKVKNNAQMLIGLHQGNVNTGIGQWHFIFDAVASIVKAIGAIRP